MDNKNNFQNNQTPSGDDSVGGNKPNFISYSQNFDSAQNGAPTQEEKPPKKSGKWKITVIITVAVFLIFGIVGAFMADDNKSSSKDADNNQTSSAEDSSNNQATSAKDAVKKMFTANLNANSRELFKYYFDRGGNKEYMDYMSKSFGMDEKEFYETSTSGKASNYDEYCDYYDKLLSERWDEIYGEDRELEIKNLKEKELSKSELEKIKKEYELVEYINEDDITEAYEVTCEVICKGSKKTTKNSGSLTMVKYKGNFQSYDSTFDKDVFSNNIDK